MFGARKEKKTKKTRKRGTTLVRILTSDITLWSCNIKAALTKSVIIFSPLSIIFALEPLWLFFTGHLVAFLILCFFQVFPGARCLAVIVSGTLRHYATIDPIGTRRMGLDRLAPKASGVKSFGHVLHFANEHPHSSFCVCYLQISISRLIHPSLIDTSVHFVHLNTNPDVTHVGPFTNFFFFFQSQQFN